MTLSASDVAASEASTSSAPKSFIAELKNGKVIFKQKPLSFEKASETMQEIVRFREFLDSRVQNQDQPLVDIPEEHKPLIVKLAQESDKNIIPLARQIRSTLLPGPGEVEDVHRLNLESNLPLAAIEQAIRMVMTRVNYGLDVSLGQKLPAAVCVWRWEVQDAYRDWLPKSARESADVRLAERNQASTHLRSTFESLSPAERNAILDPKGVLRVTAKYVNQSEIGTVSTISDEKLPEDHPLDTPIDIVDGEVPPDRLASKGRLKKVADPEKAAKIKDKEDKRTAKVEKEKKQREAQDRSRSIMVNFFGKSKPIVRHISTKDSDDTISSLNDSEFQKTFKPFVLKKDAELAPYNWFLEHRKKSRNYLAGATCENVIVIDDDAPVEDPNAGTTSNERVELSFPNDSSACFIEELRLSGLDSCITRKVPSFKTHNPNTVRITMSQLNDAEVAGDPTQVRHLLSILGDRRVFPAKVLIFHEDSRPGYYGTWTRNSREVGPRTPFERDVLARDYGYDSGEDWEDEGPGDADDVIEDGEDDEPDGEDPDSDLDSWLVDDDDDETLPPEPSPPGFDVTIPPSKRKAENREKRSEKKRKVVVPLVPYVKGPFWESYIGHCEHEPFNSYRIQLLNDTPHSVDPFTFVSVDSERQGIMVNPSPALPDSVQPSAGATTTPSGFKRTVPSAPKTLFPEAHLDALLAKMTDLATPSLTFLVESIYQDLRVHNVRKNAIEAKVREIGEKSRDKKVWVVKQMVQVGRKVSCDVDKLDPL